MLGEGACERDRDSPPGRVVALRSIEGDPEVRAAGSTCGARIARRIVPGESGVAAIGGIAHRVGQGRREGETTSSIVNRVQRGSLT